MNFDAQKLFVGLMDFFTILLPGAALTFFWQDTLSSTVWPFPRSSPVSPQIQIAIYVFASYLLGHLIFLLGSWLDGPYDWLRQQTRNQQIRRLARQGRMTPAWVRALVWLVFRREQDQALRCAKVLRDQCLAPTQASKAIKTFQWAKAWLIHVSPSNFAVVQRFEADSKFFRSFSLLLILLLLGWPLQSHWRWYGVVVLLPLLSMTLWRYMEQRFKATNQAYWAVMTVAAHNGLTVAGLAPPDPSHAGGVVYRKGAAGWEYLLISAKNSAQRWGLPKGHIEAGESAREAAVREVQEESGVWAAIIDVDPQASACQPRQPSQPVSYPCTFSKRSGEVVKVTFFLMRPVCGGRIEDFDRCSAWLTLQQLRAQQTYPEILQLLEQIECSLAEAEAPATA